MITMEWLEGASTQGDKDDLNRQIKESIPIFNILRRVLQRKLKACNKERLGVQNYSVANWSELQADRNATERTLLEILAILPEKDK